MVSTLQNALTFFRDFGLFDVVLPFLLVFAIVFALLEKTRILGEDKIKDNVVIPKRSLNSTVAFVVAMLVVATNKVVTAINIALPNVVLVVVVLVSFLMLVGMFYKEGTFDFAEQHKTWTMGFMITILVGIILIFADSVSYQGSQSWLGYVWEYVVNNYSGTVVGSIVMLIIMISAISYSTSAKGGAQSK